MRILVLLLAIAATLLAQSPASNGSVPGWQSIVNSMLSQNSGAAAGEKPAVFGPTPLLVTPLRPRVQENNVVLRTGAGSTSPCSVPLLKMQIPGDAHFTMQMVEPPTNKVDRMQVVVPAPACPESPR